MSYSLQVNWKHVHRAKLAFGVMSFNDCRRGKNLHNLTWLTHFHPCSDQMHVVVKEMKCAQFANWKIEGCPACILFTIQPDRIDWCRATRSRDKGDHLRVLTPRKLIDPVLELRQQILDRLRPTVIQRQPELIALIPRPLLRSPCQPLPIRRVRWTHNS